MWDQRYFNHLDWLSLLIRKKEIKEEYLKEHFAPSIIYDYEKIFLNHAPAEEIKDPTSTNSLKNCIKN